MSTEQYIPFNLPAIGDEEINEVVDTLRSGWLTTGKRTALFEQEFRGYVGAPFALAANSGTAALHLALAALHLKPEAEVITSPLTFCATVTTILHAGATPVLADVGPDGNLDPESVESRITGRTQAILPVHLGGLPCEMNALWSLAARHGLHVVEDAAHAVGSHYRGYPIGAGNPESGFRSSAVAYSFYATKNLTTGEGGMVVTHDPALLDEMKILCLHGISKDAWQRYSEGGNWYYQVLAPGFKYNLSDLQSAIGIHQLRKQERFIARRVEIARAYNEALSLIEEVAPPYDRAACRHAWHLYMIRLRLDKLNISRGEFIAELHRRGIGASVHFIPIQNHPYFAEYAGRPCNQCPNALALYEGIVSLPIYPGLTDAQVRRVADAVSGIVRSARKKQVFALVS